MSRFLSLPALAFLVGSALSATAQATTITQSYNFEIDLTTKPVGRGRPGTQVWTGSVSLTYDPMQSHSVSASSFTSNLGAEYGQFTVSNVYVPAYIDPLSAANDYPAFSITQISDDSSPLAGTNTAIIGLYYYEAPIATSIPDTVVAYVYSSLNGYTPTLLSASFTLQSAATTPSSVPEPTGLAVLGLGAVVLGSLSARRRPA